MAATTEMPWLALLLPLLMWSALNAAEATENEVLRWHDINDPSAVCNDFSRAGFFLRRKDEGPGKNKWVIYLESGGFCASPDTCNRRYTNSSLRPGDLLTNVDIGKIWSQNCREVPQNGSFDVSLDSQCNGVMSPLMTSLLRYAPNRSDFTITGKDFLAPSEQENPMFSDYNHVLIPYCSSDLWLGNDMRDLPQPFRFVPNKTDSIQFIFRGSVIFREAVQDLKSYGLTEAEEIVFIGSSAGGVGIMNHIKWLEESVLKSRNETLQNSNLRVSAVMDSSWFIDFRDSLRGLLLQEASPSSNMSSSPLLNETLVSNPIVASFLHLESCQNVTAGGVPCCLLAECMLPNAQFYPQHIPTMILLSLYDVYILAVSLRGDSFLASLAGSDKSTCPLQLCHEWDPSTSGNLLGSGFNLNYVQLVSEYGGTMNTSVNSVVQQNKLLSYTITSCFQHIYFAPSSLVGTGSAAYLTTDKLFSTGDLVQRLR